MEFGFACPACREEKALSPFEKRAGVSNEIYDLWLCQTCFAVLNATHLREIANGAFLEQQAETSDAFYAVDQDFLNSVPAAIDAIGFFDFLFSQYPDNPRRTMIDFGAGRGILSGAGAKYFEKVYAAELSLNVLRQVHAVTPGHERITITDDFMGIDDTFDCITSMHTLEHLPHMREILESLIAKLNPGGSLFFQVPMLRKDYLVCVHYTFFNEASARALNASLGLETVGVWFDTELDFLTCIARKP